jgi:hypothetical protein
VSLLHGDLEDSPFLRARKIKDFSGLWIYAQAASFQKAGLTQEVLNEASIGRLIDLQRLGHRKQNRNVVPVRNIRIAHNGVSKMIASPVGMAKVSSRLAMRSSMFAITEFYRATQRRKLDGVN